MKNSFLIFIIFSLSFSQENSNQLSIKINDQYNLKDKREWVSLYNGVEIDEIDFYEHVGRDDLYNEYKEHIDSKNHSLYKYFARKITYFGISFLTSCVPTTFATFCISIFYGFC